MTKQTVAIEDLLAHARWVEGFARALVRDDPDDIAQETWVAALKRPPVADRAPRAWLATVMRNMARMRYRGATRRAVREQATALADATAPDATLRMVLHKRLADCVLALPEPQRTTIVLAYYEGLTAAEIARQLAVPATTVRSRIAAALDTLRAQLDAQESGDRRKWHLALAPLIPTPAKPVAGSSAPLIAALAIAIAAAVAVVIVIKLRAATPIATAAPATPHPTAAPTTSSHRGEQAPRGLGTQERVSAVAQPSPSSAAPAAQAAPSPQSSSAPGDEDEDDGSSTISLSYMKAERVMFARLDECYELARKAGREPRGMLVMTMNLEMRRNVIADVELDRKATTVKDAEFLECAQWNATAIEGAIEDLRAAGDTFKGRLTMRIRREVPNVPKSRRPPSWPTNDASPPCPVGAKLAGTKLVHQWCELDGGIKHGPAYQWDKQQRVVVVMFYENGTSNRMQMYDHAD